MAIKAILFDMDGVLVDAREWHYMALNRALAIFGYNIDRYDHLMTYDGLPTSKKLKVLSLEMRLPEALHDFINQLKQKFTTDLIIEHCRPQFHIQFALSRLQREGYRLAVCSNSIRETVRMMMDKAELSEYLELQLSNQDVQQPKPHPDIYLKAMDMLKVSPAATLIVEDNQHGLEAAQASGAHVMHVPNPAHVTFENIMTHIKKNQLAAA